ALHAEHERGDLSGRARSSHADRPGVAARLASQARSEADATLSAISHARREAAAHARTGVRTRRRDLADLDRGAGRISARIDRARSRLRIPGWTERGTGYAGRRVHGRRTVPAQRSPRPTARGVRQGRDDPLRAVAALAPVGAGHPGALIGYFAQSSVVASVATRRPSRVV